MFQQRSQLFVWVCLTGDDGSNDELISIQIQPETLQLGNSFNKYKKHITVFGWENEFIIAR